MAIRKILVMGLPGSGKTTLATILARRLNAVHFNADAVRENVNRDLGFSVADRVEQARRMGWLCDRVTATGNFAVADLICPTGETRAAFERDGTAFIVWMDRVTESRFADTDRLFEPPTRIGMRIDTAGSPESWAERIVHAIRPGFDATKPTALFVGRYRPFHDGHKALIEEGIRRIGQACVAVRDTAGSAREPFPFEDVRARIEHALREHEGRFVVTPIPNVTAILYGRDVGYVVERLELDEEIERIPASDERGALTG